MGAKKRNVASTAGKKRRRPEAGSGTDESTTTKASSRNIDNQRISENAFSQLKFASVILVVAMMMGIAWNKMEHADPMMISFLSAICRSASCAPFVIPVRRYLQAARPIKRGETLYTIPRSLQFWDLDALRDEFVREHLISARHAKTGNALASGAFLAAWIAMKLSQSQDSMDTVQRSYLKLLPSSEQSMYHPLMWEKQNLKEALGTHSLNYAVALAYRDMVESEYSALVKASNSRYSDMVSELDYKVARINVLSRSFNPGPGSPEEDMDNDEMEFYGEHGFNFTSGCQALVPILDMLNHHPNPNVGYRYVKSKRAFVIDSKTQIPAGWELFDSYGKFTDSHLFAKFGFVNGDGSGWTQASIALFHRMLDTGMDLEFSYHSHAVGSSRTDKSVQRKHLTRYLQYDDGYVDCVEGPASHPNEFALKKLKLEHLLQIANNRKRWIVNAPPRSPASRPAESSSTVNANGIPELDPQRTNIDFSKLIETCRIISVVNSDYDGKALDMLKENLGNPDFVLEQNSDSLEHRALSCLARLAGTSLVQYSRNLEEEKTHLLSLNDNQNYQSAEWTISHLKLGEMQVLHLLSGAAFSIAKRLEETLDKTAPENTIRDRPCPKKFIEALMNNQ
ncbi:unnamed protein product [Cylindrotheca closterium]|uniref:SET domain-containing protein n=1 Tax=Cylindrotheca closterium TaxID=2856 RepID=A0AAD2CHB6_9STRA|nr:unnamed protein product [Cylindrotheca closterium]